MPFDFQSPKPLGVYYPPHGRRRRYWPYSTPIENLAYTPQEIRSWGSVHSYNELHARDRKLISDCSKKCTDSGVSKYYPEKYIQDGLMLENPGLLPALKNTPRVREIPNKPLQFVAPRFTHSKQRSHYHLLVPQKARDGLCKIAANLAREHATFIRELSNRKGGSAAAAKAMLNAPSRFSQSQDTSSEEKLKKGEKSQGNPEGIKVKKSFFNSDIDLHQIHETMAKPHKGQYDWSRRGGMESLCVTYPGNSLYIESPSDAPLLEAKVSDEISPVVVVHRRTLEVLKKIPREIMKLFLNAPKQTTATSQPISHEYGKFNHYGLLEDAKADALEATLKKLYRREKHVTVPEELLNTMYAPLKGMPEGFKFEKPQLPEVLQLDNALPLPEEMAKVERAEKFESRVRKNRKARGMRSVEQISKYTAQYTKPAIGSMANVSVKVQRKSVMSLEDYPEKYNELNKRDSSDSLFCQVGKVKMLNRERHKEEQTEDEEFDSSNERKNIDLIHLHKNKQKEQHLKSFSVVNLMEIPTFMDMTSSSESPVEEEEEEGDEENGNISVPRHAKYANVKDSRESLPYPNVAFSLIKLPSEIKRVEEVTHRHFAEDEKSLSSSEEDSNKTDGDEDETEEEENDEMNVGTSSDTALELEKIFKKFQPFLDRSSNYHMNSIKDEVAEELRKDLSIKSQINSQKFL